MASCAVIVAPLRARSTLRERRYQIPSHEAHEPLLGEAPALQYPPRAMGPYLFPVAACVHQSAPLRMIGRPPWGIWYVLTASSREIQSRPVSVTLLKESTSW